MFEKTLSDLVKGLRSNKRREAEFVSKCIAEIKEELSSKDKSHQVKANAVLKLAYLQMLGYDMQWASFHIVEVMSSPSYSHKRLGYLGASVSFHDETEVVLLCTNMFKKDFGDANPYVVGLAINCLSNICTTDLARDLVSDVVTLMSSNRAYVRKKAVLVMYKLFLKFPDALRPSFPKLKEKLEDRDTSAVSCAVNVICELARKNPQNYLALAPLFFKLLTHTSNNWMLIKIVKLLGALCPLEPRLGKKLVEPLKNLINTTPAKSLLYEAIHTVSVGMTPHLEIVELSMTKLKTFVEDEDQNLKYLGLLAMGNFMKVHPRVVAEHKAMILKCLNDEDITIRQRALDLVSGMISKKNLQDIVRILMEHVQTSEGSFRHDLVDKIIEISSANGYSSVTNFEWYISILCRLARERGVASGDSIKQQLMDVIIRVKAVRSYGISAMKQLVMDPDMYAQCSRDVSAAAVLYAAGWLLGEFCEFLDADSHEAVLSTLLHDTVLSLPEQVQSVFLQAAFKLYVANANANANGSPTPSAASVSGGNKGRIEADLLAGNTPEAGDIVSTESSKAGSVTSSVVDLLSQADTAAPAKVKPEMDVFGVIQSSTSEARAEAAAVTPQGLASDSQSMESLFGDSLPPAQTPAAIAQKAASGSLQVSQPEPVLSAGGERPKISALGEKLQQRLPAFQKSTLLEVQERAYMCFELLELARDSVLLGSTVELHTQMSVLFAEPLNPVAPKAQAKVPVPEGLDLDARIHPEEEEEDDDEVVESDEDSKSANEDQEREIQSKKKKKARDKADWGDDNYSSSDKFAVKLSKKEIKQLKKDAEKNRQKRSSDPFYLGSKKQDSDVEMLAEEDVQDIPVFNLSDDEAKAKKKKKSKKKALDLSDEEKESSAPPTPSAQMVVDMGFEMPDGGEDDEDEANETQKDEVAARLDVDLSKPLKRGEDVLPTIKAYERKSRLEVEDEMRKEKLRQKKEKKEQKDKKEKKSKKDKRQSEDGEQQEDADTGQDLLDLSDDAANARSAAGGVDLLDDLAGDLAGISIGGKLGQPKKAEKDSLDSFLDDAVAGKSSKDESDGGPPPSRKEKPSKDSKKEKKSEKKEGKRDSRSKQSEDEETEVSKDSKKDKKAEKKDGKKDKKKDKNKDRERDELPKLLPRTLGGDKNIKATYVAVASIDSAGAKVAPVNVTVTVTNCGDLTLEPVAINVTGSMSVRVTSPASEVERLARGDSAAVRLQLTVASVAKPLKVKCGIKYEASGEGAPAAPMTVSTELLLPCSSFLQPMDIMADDFRKLMSGSEAPFKSASVIEAGGRPFRHWVHLLSTLLNLKIVTQTGDAAMLYAQSVLTHHVAVNVTAKGGSMVSVDMRSSDDGLCQQLTNEVSALQLFIAP